MTRIGFIFPSSEYLFEPFRGHPHTHFQILTQLEHHFGREVALSLIDLRGIKRKFARYHIPECDIYLYSVYTLDFNELMDLRRYLKERFPKAVHIAGGPHVAVYREESMKTFDSIILGFGEEPIVKAVGDYKNGALKKAYEQDSPVDINKYPFPLRKYLPASAVARKGLLTLKKKPEYADLLGTTAIFSRGCPYNCCFCAMPPLKQYAPGVYYRRPDLIEEEIDYLKKEYGIQGFSLLDEIGIPPAEKNAAPHLEAIGRSNVLWRGQCRVDGITPLIARLAGESGCIAMGLGVESANQLSLDIINKQIQVARARETIRLLKENGIEIRIYMIIGLPGEPENIVDLTWNFIMETQPDMVILSLFTVRPGTEIFNNPARFGMKNICTDWEKTMHMFGRYESETPTMTFEYEQTTPWGRGLDRQRIIANYIELQSRLRSHNLITIPDTNK